MFIMFAADEVRTAADSLLPSKPLRGQAILMEIHPSYRLDRHFRHAARMTGKIYMPLRSQTRESCVGSSDSIVVPIAEFRETLSGAVRIARSFDDGLSECGLTCPMGILALDKRLDPLYNQPANHIGPKGAPQNTQFPC